MVQKKQCFLKIYITGAFRLTNVLRLHDNFHLGEFHSKRVFQNKNERKNSVKNLF